MRKGHPLNAEVAPLIEAARDAVVRRCRSAPHLIVLFGSEARGEATQESDIDLLVVLEDKDDVTVKEVRDAVYDVMWEHDFNRIISVVTLSRKDYELKRRKGYSFVLNVEEDGIVLWPAA